MALEATVCTVRHKSCKKRAPSIGVCICVELPGTFLRHRGLKLASALGCDARSRCCHASVKLGDAQKQGQRLNERRVLALPWRSALQERLHGHSSTIAACHLLLQLPHIGGPGKKLRACVVGARGCPRGSPRHTGGTCCNGLP